MDVECSIIMQVWRCPCQMQYIRQVDNHRRRQLWVWLLIYSTGIVKISMTFQVRNTLPVQFITKTAIVKSLRTHLHYKTSAQKLSSPLYKFKQVFSSPLCQGILEHIAPFLSVMVWAQTAHDLLSNVFPSAMNSHLRHAYKAHAQLASFSGDFLGWVEPGNEANAHHSLSCIKRMHTTAYYTLLDNGLANQRTYNQRTCTMPRALHVQLVVA